MKTFFLFFAISLFSLNSIAKADEAFWQAVASRPDAEISMKKNSDGKDLRTAAFSGGVVITEQEDGSVLGMDNTGHGAIICAWGLYTEIKNWLDKCGTEEEKKLQEIVSSYVERLNDFIVGNSVMPITKQDMGVKSKARADFFNQKIPAVTGDDLRQQCDSSGIVTFVNAMKTQPEFFNDSIDKMLSVPRPPVMNPCF
jgi:hypothetical protein